MTARRRTFLEEMGLAPVWRVRRQDSGIGIQDPASATQQAGSQVPIAEASLERNAVIARMNWDELKAAVRSCEACTLANTRTQTVFGVGDEMADWLFVGEAPGAEEDARGEPFVGQAGKLLDNMLSAIGLKRGENVYIVNVLKCRPPGNRNPEPFEVAQCNAHLLRQMALIQPRLIVALGRFAAQTLLDTDATIASLRGRVHRFHDVPTVVTYHPAYLLRSLHDKGKAWADLCLARKTMQDLASSAHGRAQ
jgi:uracil-DNA glycosylase